MRGPQTGHCPAEFSFNLHQHTCPQASTIPGRILIPQLVQVSLQSLGTPDLHLEHLCLVFVFVSNERSWSSWTLAKYLLFFIIIKMLYYVLVFLCCSLTIFQAFPYCSPTCICASESLSEKLWELAGDPERGLFSCRNNSGPALKE